MEDTEGSCARQGEFQEWGDRAFGITFQLQMKVKRDRGH